MLAVEVVVPFDGAIFGEISFSLLFSLFHQIWIIFCGIRLCWYCGAFFKSIYFFIYIFIYLDVHVGSYFQTMFF